MFNSLMFSIECLPFFLSSRNCTHNKLCIISWIMLIPVNSAVAFRSACTFLPCTSETVHLLKKSTSLSSKEGLKTLFPLSSYLVNKPLQAVGMSVAEMWSEK